MHGVVVARATVVAVAATSAVVTAAVRVAVDDIVVVAVGWFWGACVRVNAVTVASRRH